jgi:hypothetical protein
MEAASDSKIINIHRCKRHRELGSCNLYKNVYLVAESYGLLIDRDIINNICYKVAVPSLRTINGITLKFSGAGTNGIVGGELHRAVFRSTVATLTWHICCNATSTMSESRMTMLELWYWNGWRNGVVWTSIFVFRIAANLFGAIHHNITFCCIHISLCSAKCKPQIQTASLRSYPKGHMHHVIDINNRLLVSITNPTNTIS